MSNLLHQAMTYGSPPEIPFSSWIVPAAWIHYGDEMHKFAKEYPEFCSYVPDLNNMKMWMAPSYCLGNWTDEWGCIWSNTHEGLEGIVTGHPVPTREDIHKLKLPANTDGRIPHGFLYLRLLDLRGFEEAMIDFAEECGELQILINKVVEHNLKQLDYALPKIEGNYMVLGDDLGMQNGLAIGAEKWRKYMKPAFKKIYDKIHAAGKDVYMHTDGMIYEIMPDLAEIGATMINPQFRANGLDNLVRVCKGKIPVNIDMDRQLFPYATPSQLDDHIRECIEAMYLPEGGLGISIEISYDVPLQNAAALFDAARKYKYYKG